MILSDPSLPAEYRLSNRLTRLHLDPNVVLAILEKHRPLRPLPNFEWHQILELVSGPINADTLDGIYRAAYLSNLPCPDPLRILLAFFRRDKRIFVRRDHLHTLDEFWLAKARVYAEFINPLESKLWEMRYAKTALKQLDANEGWKALGVREAAIRGDLEVALREAEEKDISELAFRRPRDYFIDETETWHGSEIPLPELARRYRSEAKA
jgi:hypothetical protein